MMAGETEQVMELSCPSCFGQGRKTVTEVFMLPPPKDRTETDVPSPTHRTRQTSCCRCGGTRKVRRYMPAEGVAAEKGGVTDGR